MLTVVESLGWFLPVSTAFNKTMAYSLINLKVKYWRLIGLLSDLETKIENKRVSDIYNDRIYVWMDIPGLLSYVFIM